MRQLSLDESSRMRVMAILCAFLVVSIHTHVRFIEGSANWIVHYLFVGVIARVAVPYFFFASGYFMAKTEHEKYLRIIKKKTRTLFIPYLIFLMVFIVYYVLISAAYNYVVPGIRELPSLTLQTVLDWSGVNLRAFPIYGILWYIRTLIVFVLCSPLFFFVLKSRFTGVMLLIGMACFSIFAEYVSQMHWIRQVNSYYFSLYGPWYYFTGLWWALNGRSLRLNPIVILILSLAFLFGSLMAVSFGKMKIGMIFVELFIPFGMLILYLISGKMKWILNYSIAPIAIYLLHCFLIAIFTNLSMLFGVDKLIQTSLLCFFACWFGVFIFTVLLVKALVRFFPVCSYVMFGGRLTDPQVERNGN